MFAAIPRAIFGVASWRPNPNLLASRNKAKHFFRITPIYTLSWGNKLTWNGFPLRFIPSGHNLLSGLVPAKPWIFCILVKAFLCQLKIVELLRVAVFRKDGNQGI